MAKFRRRQVGRRAVAGAAISRANGLTSNGAPHPAAAPAGRGRAGSARTQLLVVNRGRTLLETLAHVTGIELVKDLGETRVAGQGRFKQPSWHWPQR